MSKNLLGKWAREKEQGGDYEVIEVIDTDGLRAYVKGPQAKPISINDLGKVWKRMDQLVADPFASEDLAALKSADPTMVADMSEEMAEEMAIIQSTANETVQHKSAYIEHVERVVQTKEVVFESANPEEAAIEAIIKASVKPATIKLTLEVEVPIDLRNLSTVANALSISCKTAATVVAKMTKLDLTVVQSKVSDAILVEMDVASQK